MTYFDRTRADEMADLDHLHGADGHQPQPWHSVCRTHGPLGYAGECHLCDLDLADSLRAARSGWRIDDK